VTRDADLSDHPAVSFGILSSYVGRYITLLLLLLLFCVPAVHGRRVKHYGGMPLQLSELYALLRRNFYFLFLLESGSESTFMKLTLNDKMNLRIF